MKILIIKLRYIGDVLLSTPVVRCLRENFPTAHLAMAVNQGTEEVLRHNPDLDEVLVVERRGLGQKLTFLAGLRHRFDCVIDLTDGDRSAFLGYMTGAPRRIGFNKERRWRGLLYTEVLRPSGTMHIVEYHLEAVRALGLTVRDPSPVFLCTEQEERFADEVLPRGQHLILIHPGARFPWKAWPPERFARVADHIQRECGGHVILAGGQSDLSVVADVQAFMETKALSVAGRTSLLQLGAIVKRCRLFLGTDNGPMHLAAAVGTPVVALFGPTNPAVWGPWGKGHTILYKRNGGECGACHHAGVCLEGEEGCMKQISVEEVVSAVRASAISQRDSSLRSE